MIGGFRRSNKRGNIRKKIETTASDEEDNEEGEMAVDSPSVVAPVCVSSGDSKSKIKKSGSSLSFVDDMEGGDEFILKRSKASMNMHDQVRREKKKKKKKSKNDDTENAEENGKETKESNSGSSNVPEDAYQSTPQFQIKTFDEYEEIEDDSDVSNRFSSRSRFGMPGDIPDAATIYAMKKRREQARQFGGQLDYIPMNATVKYEGRFSTNNSRLVREEMDLNSSDEERMEMKGKQTYNPVLERRKQVARALEEAEEMDDENDSEHQDEEEIAHWENEQIKKGSHIPTPVQQKYGPVLPGNNTGNYGEKGFTKTYTIPTNDQQTMPVDFVIKRLTEQLDSKKQLHRLHTRELEKTKFDLDASKKSITELNEKAEQLEEKFSFFQDMRGFSKDLIECLSEKVRKIKSLEETMNQSMKKKNDLIANRRQNDVKDETEEVSGRSVADSDRIANIKNRRIAEREARRTRRREKRSQEPGGGANHFEGQSSDDELIPSDHSKFKADRDKVMKDRASLFEDVVSNFSSVKEILSRFELWKFGFSESYKDAYMGLCLPKLLTPFIKLELLQWNPLEAHNQPDFEDMKWFQAVSMYGYHGDKIDENDDDLNLVPLIVEKILIPKLTVIVQDAWDPLSRKQTRLLTFLFQRLVDDYPTVTKQSKSVQKLVETIVDRLKSSVEAELFIPLYPKTALEGKNPKALFFLERQFWKGVKLLENLMQWNWLLSQKKLQQLGVDAILNRYLIIALQQFPDPLSSFEKTKYIINILPKEWFDKSSDEIIAGLECVTKSATSV